MLLGDAEAKLVFIAEVEAEALTKVEIKDSEAVEAEADSNLADLLLPRKIPLNSKENTTSIRPTKNSKKSLRNYRYFLV